MARHVDKLWVTNLAALRTAYGGAGAGALRAALRQLAGADHARGLGSRVLDVSSARSAAALGVPAAPDPSDRAGVQALVDAACAAARPDYLVLLGGPTVVPHQLVDNPVYDPVDDPERSIPSDLPYATGVASSRAADHVGATRVVGRVPDLPGSTDPAALLALLAQARGWTSAPPESYSPVLAVSTAAWRASTALGVHALPTVAEGLHVVPPEHPPWPAFARHRTLFVNLHGATADPVWYGDRGGLPLPAALSSADLLPAGGTAVVAPGTVVGTEACYGAELYDPARAGGRPGIAVTWLQQGAYAVLGSTNTSYGGVNDALGADVLVRLWLAGLLAGASTGRALLQARQQLAAEPGELDPVDLKTLAQFLLLGDPSVHPVAVGPAVRGLPGGRASRRATLAGVGGALDRAVVRPRAVARRPRAAGRYADVAQWAAATGGPEAVASLVRLTDSGAWLRSVTARPPAARGPAVRFHLVGGGAATGRELLVVREGADGAVSTRRLVARCSPVPPGAALGAAGSAQHLDAAGGEVVRPQQ